MTGRRADLVAACAALGLFGVAAVTGGILYLAGHPVHASAAPLFAHWLPHAGPGTLPAVAIAVLVLRYGPVLAERLSWRRLTAVAYVTALAWIVSLALVDGWRRGVAGRLTTRFEYLHEVAGVTDIPATLRGFTSRILDFQPDSWTTHVAGHPPGALLVFVWLDRAGLPGGGWAALLCMTVGATTAVAVPETLRVLSSEDAARAAVPFTVLFPGAVWVGVSADGLFAGVTTAGLALLAVAVVHRSRVAALAAGLVLGFGCYLSYGLVLLGLPALMIMVFGRARFGVAVCAALGAVGVAAAFTIAGFNWLTGYHLLVQRYYQGVAAQRPYGYWVWANLAILAVACGPAAAVVLRRAVRRGVWRCAPVVAPLTAAVVIVAADLSGYSKAEVERIWLPFGVWFMAGAVLIPRADRRLWLGVQAATALAVNHLLLTGW